jgi:ASCH domain
MKAITIKQPYAQLICEGIKDIENRTWKTNYRGRVLIHAGADKKMALNVLTSEQRDYFINSAAIKDVKEWKRSAIIGSVEIVDCVKNHTSVWAIENNWHWVLANPILFGHPILNVKGQLSFWDYETGEYPFN